jgi:hypothetical protein
MSAKAAMNDDAIYGPCIMNAQLEKGFRVLPALCHTTYPSGIESLFSTSIEQVAQTLNYK